MDNAEVTRALRDFFAAPPEREADAALDLSSALRAGGHDVDVALHSINTAQALTYAEFEADAEAVVLLRIDDRIVLWQPEDKANVAVFLLE